MEKINEIPKISNKERGISNKMTVSFSLASILKLVLAIALLMMLMAAIAYAGDVIVENGKIDVDSKLFVADNGNVGVGTTSPVKKLEVLGDMHIIGPDGMYFYRPVDNVAAIQGTRNDYTTPSELVLNPNGGNIGIGTTAPSQILHAYSNTVGGRTQLRVQHAPASGVALSQIYFVNPTQTWGIGNTNDYLVFYDETYNKEQMVILKNSGNVGIGTTSPQNKLDVVGNSYFHTEYTDAQILAEATCTALKGGGWTFAVRRECSGSAPDCAVVCASLTDGQAGVLSCFNSLHIYSNQPAESTGAIGLKTYKYNGCGGGCGPNYCCCGN